MEKSGWAILEDAELFFYIYEFSISRYLLLI